MHIQQPIFSPIIKNNQSEFTNWINVTIIQLKRRYITVIQQQTTILPLDSKSHIPQQYHTSKITHQT